MFRRHGAQRPSVTKDKTWRERSSDTAFHNFIYPFEVEIKEDLFSLSSGARTHAEVANDILNVETVGIQNLYTEEVCCQNSQLPCISSNAVLDIS